MDGGRIISKLSTSVEAQSWLDPRNYRAQDVRGERVIDNSRVYLASAGCEWKVNMNSYIYTQSQMESR